MELPSNSVALRASRPAWPLLLPWLVLVALLLLLFRDTAVAMVGIWYRSETYAHAFLVPPIVLWLVWRLRGRLAALAPRPAPLALVPMALACLLWLLGELAGVNAASQFALVALLVLTVPLVFGGAVARVLAFPLAFLFFCVPVGEFLTPVMVDRTADFTVAALRASGVPVYREGNQFVIPSGNWSVVEACSGVRYLIASVMVGTLFAYLNFRSLWRRLAFVAVAIAVPIVANWLRAYMIVMLGHLSGNRLAVGADHLVYGWVFFGIVILAMFMIGARFAESPDDAAAPAGAARGALGAPQAAAAPAARTWATVAAGVLLLLATQGAMWRLDHREIEPVPPLAAPAELAGGWTTGEPAANAWAPQFGKPNVELAREYRNGTQEVSVWIGYFRDQGPERKLVSSTNVLADEKSADWMQVSQGRAAITAGGRAVAFNSALLRSPSDPNVSARRRLRVLYVYRIAGRFVARDAEAKLLTAMERLLGRGDDGAVIVFSAPVDGEGAAAGPGARAGADALDGFVAQHLDAFAAVLDAPARSAVAR